MMTASAHLPRTCSRELDTLNRGKPFRRPLLYVTQHTDARRDARDLFCGPLLLSQARTILCAGEARGLPFPAFALRRGQGRPRKHVHRRAHAHRRECARNGSSIARKHALTLRENMPFVLRCCLRQTAHSFKSTSSMCQTPDTLIQPVASLVTVGMLSIPSQPIVRPILAHSRMLEAPVLTPTQTRPTSYARETCNRNVGDSTPLTCTSCVGTEGLRHLLPEHARHCPTKLS